MVFTIESTIEKKYLKMLQHFSRETNNLDGHQVICNTAAPLGAARFFWYLSELLRVFSSIFDTI